MKLRWLIGGLHLNGIGNIVVGKEHPADIEQERAESLIRQGVAEEVLPPKKKESVKEDK